MLKAKHLRLVDAPKIVRKPKKRSDAKRQPESAAEIGARILKGRKPAKELVFTETVKAPGDVVISSIGRTQ